MQFCSRVSEIERLEVEVLSRPDRESPGRGGCDAIILRAGRKCALEHTTVDAYSDQRSDSARFRKVVVPIEKALSAAFPDECIEVVVPSHAIPVGMNWDDIGQALRVGLLKEVRQLPRHERPATLVVSGVPFPVSVTKRAPAYGPECFVGRSLPEGRDEDLVGEMERVIRDKTEQLAPYRRDGMITIVLIEWDDIALLDRVLVAEGFAEASRRVPPDALDEVYLADATRKPIWFYPVKLGHRRYPDLPDFRRYFDAQCHLVRGWDLPGTT